MNNRQWWSKNKVLVFSNREQYYNHMAVEFLENAEKCISEKGCFIAVLGGGSSPAYINAGIVQHSRDYNINWKQVAIVLSDERYVEETSDFSNRKMIMETLIEPLEMNPLYQIFQSDRTVAEAVQLYEDYIKELLYTKKQSSFDYALLGVGKDGHTASLFPGRQWSAEQDKVAVHGGIGPEGTERISLSFEALNKCTKMSFLVNNKQKQEILQLMEHNWNPLDYPIQNISVPKNMYVLLEE